MTYDLDYINLFFHHNSRILNFILFKKKKKNISTYSILEVSHMEFSPH